MSYAYHSMVLVSDIAQSKQFYNDMFSMLGWETHAEEEDAKAWSKDTFNFWIAPAKNNEPIRHNDGVGVDHLAFRVDTKEEVDTFHNWLLETNATVEISPKPFPEYSANYYAVFFHDPDGTRLEVVFA